MLIQDQARANLAHSRITTHDCTLKLIGILQDVSPAAVELPLGIAERFVQLARGNGDGADDARMVSQVLLRRGRIPLAGLAKHIEHDAMAGLARGSMCAPDHQRMRLVHVDEPCDIKLRRQKLWSVDELWIAHHDGSNQHPSRVVQDGIYSGTDCMVRLPGCLNTNAQVSNEQVRQHTRVGNSAWAQPHRKRNNACMCRLLRPPNQV